MSPLKEQNNNHLAFISYSHKDKVVAYSLYSFLCSYKLPKTVSRIEQHSTFIDGHLRTGKLWKMITSHLEKSERLIVLCSPYSAEDNEDKINWVNREICHFIQHHGGIENVFLLRLNPKLGDSAMPSALRQYDLSKNTVLYDRDIEEIIFISLFEKILYLPAGTLLKTDNRLESKFQIFLKIFLWGGSIISVVPAIVRLYFRNKGIDTKSGLCLLMRGILPSSYEEKILEIAPQDDVDTLRVLLKTGYDKLTDELLRNAMEKARLSNKRENVICIRAEKKRRAAKILSRYGVAAGASHEAILSAVEEGNAILLENLLYLSADYLSFNIDLPVISSFISNPQIAQTIKSYVKTLLFVNESDLRNPEEKIIFAANEGNIEQLRLLLLAGVSPDTADSAGVNVLCHAVRRGNLLCIKELVAAGADVQRCAKNTGFSAIFSAIFAQHLEIIRYLFMLGNTEHYFFNDGGYVIQGNSSLALFAIYQGKDAALKELLSCGVSATRGADVFNDGQLVTRLNLYEQAIIFKRSECLQILLDFDQTIDMDTLASFASMHGSTGCLKILLARQVNPNHTNHQGNTLLHLAVGCDNGECVKLLCDSGANTEFRNMLGYTPIAYACFFEKLDALKSLIECKADIDAVNDDGESAIFNAAVDNKLKVLEYIIDAGANINLQNLAGETPLMKAVSSNAGDAVKMLCLAGADQNLVTKRGRTALDIAKRNNYEEILHVLQPKVV